MSPLPRPQASPGVLVRALVSLGAASAVAAAVAAYVAGRAVPGPGFGVEFVTLVAIGALSRRFGVALPGNGYSSYILGVTAFALLDRGWACAVLVGPAAMVAGDLVVRRLPARAALVNAAHLTAGTAVVSLMYDRLGGVAGPDALDPANLGPLVALLALLGGRVAHGALGDDRVRLLDRAGARLAASRPRRARPARDAGGGGGAGS